MTDKSDIEKLNEERLLYKTEMLKALSCRTKKQKIKLANQWKENNLRFISIFALRVLVRMADSNNNTLGYSVTLRLSVRTSNAKTVHLYTYF